MGHHRPRPCECSLPDANAWQDRGSGTDRRPSGDLHAPDDDRAGPDGDEFPD
jgi:hypothetical protein